MKRSLLCLTVVCSMVGFVLMGCGDASRARFEVAKDATLKKLDAFLGKLDITRKEIDLAVIRLKDTANEIAKQKITTQVKVDQLQARTQPLRDQIVKADSSLKRIRELIATGTHGEIAGKTYSLDEFKKMAHTVLDARKMCESQLVSFDQTQSGLKKLVTTLEERQSYLQGKVARLEADLTKIDAQMASVNAIKEASAAIGDSGATLDQDIAWLEDKVAALMAETHGELALEGEKWDFSNTDTEIATADSIIAKTQHPLDMLSEIDKVLAIEK